MIRSIILRMQYLAHEEDRRAKEGAEIEIKKLKTRREQLDKIFEEGSKKSKNDLAKKNTAAKNTG